MVKKITPNFIRLTDSVIDPNKKNILVIDKLDDTVFTNTDGTGKIIANKLEETYNVYRVYVNCPKHDDLPPNSYYIKMIGDDIHYYRQKDEGYSYEKNVNTFFGLINEMINELPKFELGLLVSNTIFTLPLTTYCYKNFNAELYEKKSEYFDYIGDDKEIIDQISQINVAKFNRQTWIKTLSPYAISTRGTCYIMGFLTELYNQGCIKKYITFLTDPGFARPFFDLYKIPITYYYYVNEKRGTRDFTEFPIAQFQTLLYEEERRQTFDSFFDEDNKKDKNVIFAGTVFHEKGPRTAIWNEFLNDFKDPKSSYHIPIKKNGIITKKIESSLQVNFIQERFAKMYEEVINHVSYKPFILPSEMTKEFKKYKYGLVFRCVSVEPSLNTKTVQYLANDVLPLYDHLYDVEHDQIPKHIKNKLSFGDSKGLQQLVDYYNENETERNLLLNNLKKLFKIDEFRDNIDGIVEKQIDRIIEENLT